MNTGNLARSGSLKLAIGLALIVFVVWTMFDWTFNRIYVRPGQSLVIRYKGPVFFGKKDSPANGRLARVTKDGEREVGVYEKMLGPGRHFYSPLWWERTRYVDDVVVEPGELLLVSCLQGEEPAADTKTQGISDQFLVEGDIGDTKYRGILRKVYGPGRYRVNPYAYTAEKIKHLVEKSGTQEKHSGWVEIRTGNVGVVTNQTDNPITGAKKGIQRAVLPPGIYPMNPREQKVDIVEIGFREKSIISTPKMDRNGTALLDESGEPVMSTDNSGISFPSRDGFTIHMDFTAIWGVLPDQAPRVVDELGNLSAVETRVVAPFIESICRNEGSKLGAVELLIGNTREHFQDETRRLFAEELKQKGVILQYGLVRHIYVPQEVRLPIQQKYVADELKLTRDQEQLTTKTEALLREAERKVELEASRVQADTEKLVAQKKAEGGKTAAETKAETLKRVAEIDRQTAELEAQAQVLLGTAQAGAQQALEEAKAGKFALAVAAFGSGAAFNQWVFASGLPDNIQLNLLYAGPGTFWTDLKGFTNTLMGKQAADAQRASDPKP